MTRRYHFSAALLLCASSCFSWLSAASLLAQDKPAPVTEIKGDARTPLVGTKKLEMEGDIAAQLVDGVDKFLLREIEKSVAGRAKFWKRDLSSPAAYNKSIEPNRQRLAHILGVRDKRVPFDAPELVGTTKNAALVGKGENFEIYAVRWPVIGDVHGEGLMLVPIDRPILASVVVLPDCQSTPEHLCTFGDRPATDWPIARRLVHSGCRVVIPTLIDREMKRRAPPGRQGGANLTNREYVYRSAFELGRHLIGYEVQKVLACVDWFEKESDKKVGVAGYGEGGLIALYAAALDTRIDSCLASGSFGASGSIWSQPIDRNVFGLLNEFGDEELAAMVAPRRLVIEAMTCPAAEFPSDGGAPAKLPAPLGNTVAQQLKSSEKLVGDIASKSKCFVFHDETDPKSLERTLEEFGGSAVARDFLVGLKVPFPAISPKLENPKQLRKDFDTAARQARQIMELDRHSQELLKESEYVRDGYMKKLYDSPNLEAYNKTVEDYREKFATEVIGRFNIPLLEPAPRSRKAYETEKWTGYEVVLDVWPDVIAYGILILPKDLKEGEKRPVVVCQHGLEGRPQDTIGEPGFQYYSAFAGRLAERGFITFSPQNLYIGKDRFRTLQRKANPLGKTLFSVIVPQHQQICNWLGTLPMVDKDRIAFYGLSYGGKSAMRIPPLVKNYCLSICSADFNEWVSKNASTRLPFSYVWTGEYEIFEFDLGSTFNYAEMAALICPRPFMVERGHTDGVSEDWWVSYEYAKVFFNYSHRLKIGDRCELEVFDGPHKINGVKTYEFLHKHLKWPVPK